MTPAIFVDTNVLLYARDASEPDKQPRAQAWLEFLWRERAGRLSVQVLQEYYVNVTGKLSPGLDEPTARRDVRALAAWEPVTIEVPILESAWALQDQASFSWWDALIVAAAKSVGARYLLTEDMQAGRRLGDLEILDPFDSSPDDLPPFGARPAARP